MKGKIDRWITVLIVANFVIVAVLLSAALADWLKRASCRPARRPSPIHRRPLRPS